MTADLKYSLYAVFSALAAAAGLIMTEIGVQSMSLSVLTIAVGSNYVAGTFLLLWAAARGGCQWFGWGRADWLRLLAGAVATYAVGFLLLYTSIGMIGTSKTSLLGRLETVFIVILAVIFLGEIWTRRHWLASLTALAGAVIISFDPSAWSLDVGWGEILAVLSAIVFSIGIIALKSVLNRHSGLLVSGYGLLIGAIVLTPFLLVAAPPSQDAAPTGIVLGMLGVRGILLGMSWISYNVAMQHIGASRSSIMFLSIGFLSILLQVIVDTLFPDLGLQLPADLGLAVLGGVVICVGIYFVSTAPTDSRHPVQPVKN
ncbi:MAG: EamA family transporter [Gemmatimonadetes bacterium]|jgi:drug/metabolite transporter (DMT)-like permease|nr:EamA family transporter [Gemmatimonadota bacterium]MBT4613201.1 EamA family transporter [Gemmatimonadota bacterium]MBT5057054.1 EamA family transporter [Gemmatimonadota bacterium]MBT5146823.1 EamA family transporter [Gemmatimonadota bacterium]MBT5590112.1 EamA family transporter [Gemmatimonadota bacterium]